MGRDLFQGYNKLIGGSAIKDALIKGLGAYATTSVGGKMAKGTLNTLAHKYLPKPFKNTFNDPKIFNKLPWLAALLATSQGLYNPAYTSRLNKDTINSITDKNFYTRNPSKLKDMLGASYPLFSESKLEKVSSLNNLDYTENIPVGFSTSVIQSDPFMPLEHKKFTMGVIHEANGNQDFGHTSEYNVLASATRAGVGGLAGYGLAKVVSSVFTLSPTVSKGLSTTGALAGAIANVLE